MAEAAANEVVAPVAGTPEYDAAMAAKVDESAAKALESAGGVPQAPAVEVAPTETPKEPEKVPEEKTQEEAKEAVEAAGIDYSKLQSEWEAGGLSEDSYKALEKAGFSKDIVDGHIAGQEALAELRVMKGAEVAGGREQLANMQAWAKTGLSQAEIDAYNKGVNGSTEEMTQAIQSLRSRYESAYGSAPNLLGGRPASAAPAGYASKAEMTTDMRSPQYAKDPAFRAKVAAKVAATTAF